MHRRNVETVVNLYYKKGTANIGVRKGANWNKYILAGFFTIERLNVDNDNQ